MEINGKEREMTEIAVVAGWSAVEFEFDGGGRYWLDAHDGCVDALIKVECRCGTGLSDVDGVCENGQDLVCAMCGKGR